MQTTANDFDVIKNCLYEGVKRGFEDFLTTQKPLFKGPFKHHYQRGLVLSFFVADAIEKTLRPHCLSGDVQIKWASNTNWIFVRDAHCIRVKSLDDGMHFRSPSDRFDEYLNQEPVLPLDLDEVECLVLAYDVSEDWKSVGNIRLIKPNGAKDTFWTEYLTETENRELTGEDELFQETRRQFKRIRKNRDEGAS